jgi:hypothetical protein
VLFRKIGNISEIRMELLHRSVHNVVEEIINKLAGFDECHAACFPCCHRNAMDAIHTVSLSYSLFLQCEEFEFYIQGVCATRVLI